MGLEVKPPPILGDVPTLNDSEANAILKNHAYFAQGPGFVNAYTIGETTSELNGYVDLTNDPAGVGIKISHDLHTSTDDDCNVHFFVAQGLYFEIMSDGTPTIFWTPLMRSGPPPIDFN